MSMSLQLALKQRNPNNEYELSRTYIVEYQGNRPARGRSYRGPASEAALVAQRWLDGDPDAVRVVTEAGEVVAEK